MTSIFDKWSLLDPEHALDQIDGALAGLGGGDVKIATLILDRVALTNLFSAPAVIVPAPGTGKLLLPINMIFSYAFGTTPYISPDNAESVTYGNGVAGNIDIFSNAGIMARAFVGNASSIITGIADSTEGLEQVINASVNQPLVFGEPSADASGGDGTVTLSIVYAIVPV